MKILVIEDEQQNLSEELKKFHAIDVAFSAREAELKIYHNQYDLVVIESLFINIRELRSGGIQTPILVISSNSEVKYKVQNLDSGADDYLTKPFSFEELSARMRALMRRPRDLMVSNVLSIGDLRVDLDNNKVRRGRKSFYLRRKEFAILAYLIRNVGRVLTRDMILGHVWESTSDPDINTIDVHIKHLRDSIDREFRTKLIKTVHGVGYKLEL